MVSTKTTRQYEESCLNCAFWKRLKKAEAGSPPAAQEGMCEGKYNGDFVTGNQYCLGFQKRGAQPAEQKNQKAPVEPPQ